MTCDCPYMAEAEKRIADLTQERDEARRELEMVNNSFGCMTWQWPEAWKRVEGIKAASGEHYRKWRDAEERATAAQDALRLAQARVVVLEAALEPFARAAEAYKSSHDMDRINARPGWAGKDYIEVDIIARDLRRARTVLAPCDTHPTGQDAQRLGAEGMSSAVDCGAGEAPDREAPETGEVSR